MGRYGLGFGALSSARGTRGGSPADTASLIGPSASWTGTAGSGFASPPVDPVRTTAKPAMRIITPPRQAFTDRLIVGVVAGANDEGTLINNLGIDKVTVHFEGNSIDISAPTLRSFADANGETVQYFGWWAVLQNPGSTSGTAHVYFEAVPRDATMQRRVMGPYAFLPRAMLYDAQLEVDSTQAASGLRFQTMLTALDHVRSNALEHPLITITGGSAYDLEQSDFPYQVPGLITVKATVPVTFTRQTDDDGSFRPRRGPLRFMGENITFDFVRASNLYTEPGAHAHWLDGVNITNSAGRDSLRWKAPRNLLAFLIRERGWMTECNVTNMWAGGMNCSLVRGCVFSNSWSDLFTASDCVIGNTANGLDSTFYRTYLNAINGTGPANSTLAMSGTNSQNNRVLTAKVGTTTVGTFTVQTGFTAFTADTNYTVESVVAWLNSLSGWSATADDTTRFAAALQADNTVGAWSMNTAGAFLVKTFFDTHADLFQHNGENFYLAGNSGTGIAAQNFFLDDADSRDIVYINNSFDNTQTGNLSQLSYPQSHVVIAHNTHTGQGLALRNDFGGALKYNPDAYCLIANNAFSTLAWSNPSAGDADLVIAFNHLNGGAAVPQGALGTSVGGSALGNFADAAMGDFTPQGALLAFPKPPTVRYDARNNARRSPVAPVGAVRAPVGSDVTAPIITSADPSGSYPEGAAIAGQLIANEPVSWLVSGQDASAVTLNPDTGVWSVGPTEYALQPTYAFTFEAIDAQGNGTSQPVALAITPASATRPSLTSFADEANGANAAIVSVETDTPDGLLYWAITTDGSVPDANAIKAGSGVAASGSQSVTATGLQTIAITGLAAATSYIAYLVHTSGSGEDSDVAAGDGFSTLSATSSTATAIILIVAGQSNARKAATTNAGLPPDSRYAQTDVSMWIAASGAPVPYVAKTNSGHQGAAAEWGTEAEAVYQMRQAGETRPIYIVKESVNGNDLAGNWNPATSGSRFDGLEAQVAALRSWLAANTAHTQFDEYALWNQGEADATDATKATNYAANWTAFLAAFRTRVSANAFFIAERIRPLGYATGNVITDTAGFGRAYQVREATLAGLLADGNGTVIDTDFDFANFTNIHPPEPGSWTIDSWTTQIGLRAHAAIAGTYAGTYGAIADAVPDAFTIPAASGEQATIISSSAIAIAGIERRTAVTLPPGLEMRILNWNDSVHTDWTNTPGFIDKLQKFAVRATAPDAGVTDDYAVTIGAVSATFSLTGTAPASYRADTTAWLAALVTAGGASLSPAQEAGLDAYLAALDTAGILPRIGAHVYALGSEIANTIRIDDPTLIATQSGTTALPWADGYLATANNQNVDLAVDPSALTSATSISLTVIVSALGSTSLYAVNTTDSTIGLRLNGTVVRFRAHNFSHTTFNGLNLTKPGAYTATSDGTTAKLFDPDGIEIGSVAAATGAAATATNLLIGNSGTTDKTNRVWGVVLSNLLTPTQVATLHSELATLRALF